jgi:hypothetical protein
MHRIRGSRRSKGQKKNSAYRESKNLCSAHTYTQTVKFVSARTGAAGECVKTIYELREVKQEVLGFCHRIATFMFSRV